MSVDTGCSCGCGAVTSATNAGEPCSCGCVCCVDEEKTKEEELAELRDLLRSVKERISELGENPED